MKSTIVAAISAVRSHLQDRRLPESVKVQIRTDREGLPDRDAGCELVMELAMQWLALAQDRSASADGGVSRDYSLIRGWATSYPETTGYIVPTFLAYAKSRDIAWARERARRMLDWLVAVQMPSGAIQGGKIDSHPVVPVPFNTGQVLLGLVAGERELGGYGEPLRRAADWLVRAQDPDGAWRRHQTPFAMNGAKTYDTHISWGLFEAARLEPGRGYAEAAAANVRWALSLQAENGWFDQCCLSDFSRPLSHTLGYALRGILEAYRYTSDDVLLRAARRTGDGLLGALREDGHLPGQLLPDWRPATDWACLTGTAQVAYCWLYLYRETADPRYLKAGLAANAYVRRTVAIDGPPAVRGAVRGSFPIGGKYCQYAYPNWAAKFLIDSLMLEQEIRRDSLTGRVVDESHA